MITSVGLNPCIDSVIRVKSIEPGHYDIKPKFFLGGSAINIVLVTGELRRTGIFDKETRAEYSGFIDKGKIYKLLLKKKVSTEYCIFTKGESRINYTIIPSRGNEMHLKSSGPNIRKEEYKEFENLFDKITKDSNVIIISGKLPPNAERDYYNKFIKKANNANLYTAIDTRGETLRRAIKSVPFFLKCNLMELALLLNKERINSVGEIMSAETIFGRAGVSIAVVSGGRNGIYVFYKGKFMAQYKLSEEIITKSTTGAGDIILTYFTVLLDYVKRGIKRLSNENINEAAVFSVAYSSASTMTPYPSVFESKTAERFLKKVIIIRNSKKVSFIPE
ncbi:PfkB family carbohydrate kinase [candidate division KSB1 bacterium]